MIHNKLIKLKKYLFLISVLFLVVSLSHLVYMFMYYDSKLVPIKGGTVSEWLIGSFPSLNPLKPLNWNNKYIVDLLYRSLLSYDAQENKLVADIASCDISNLYQIECYIQDNVFWSNGEAITAEDVVATYNLLKETWVNKVMSSLLEESDITSKDNVITFNNAKEDINFLNIFFQPILSTETVNTLWNDAIFWNFPTHGQIYSWDFKISNISSDMTIWVTQITLDRNEYNMKGNIAKLMLKLFPNTNSFLQNKEQINIFNDNESLIWDSIPRLENHQYTLPQFVGLYLNQNNIKDVDLRNHIFSKINTTNLIKLLWEQHYSEVNNPYLSDINIQREIENKNFEEILKWLGYIKKSKIIENYLPKSKETYSDEAKISENTGTWTANIESWSGSEITLDLNDDELVIDPFQEDSKYITSPDYVDKYNFITKDDILLTWNAGKNVEDVYINNYKLTNFQSGNSKFYYRLKEIYNSIKVWENNYKIYFVENGKKVLKEEITFLYYKTNSELATQTKEFIKNLYIEKKKQEIALQKESEKQTDSEKIEIDKEKFEQISNLEDKFYYNNDLEKYSLSLYYISSEKHMEDSAFFIKNALLEIGINVEIFPISIADLRSLLSEKSKYDMLLTGINLWYFDYNIFPYFHSSQAKNWYNFSALKKTSLDILLEDLKSGIKTPEETTKLQTKILWILQNEQIVKTLYTPKLNLLIDKNIKNIDVDERLVNKSYRKKIYDTIYIKEEKIINFENKTVMKFFDFLLRKLNG